MIKQRWDIFCKIVDNFGDIGVCWRLARHLQSEHGLQIKLWIDDLGAAQKIISGLNIVENSQVCEEIKIQKWYVEADFSQAAEVVIEAFACCLPPAYLAAMARQHSKWVNLEYLSAETWVDDFHAKPSPQDFLNLNNGLVRYFYFPGFTNNSGGLIRESKIIEQNQLFADNKQLQNNFWQALQVANFAALKISLFCYPHAPIAQLLNVLSKSDQLINCYVPASSILPQIAEFFGKKTLKVGDNLQHKNLQLQVLPFLSQANYDKLLCTCDLNFVRGEDSWVRAIWAGKPFIWQPYFQDENTHIKKMNAFLDLFYADIKAQILTQSSFPRRRKSNSTTKNKMDSSLRGNDGVDENCLFRSVANAHHAWLSSAMTTKIWQNYLVNLAAIKSHSLEQAAQLAKQADLAAKLVIFCDKI